MCTRFVSVCTTLREEASEKMRYPQFERVEAKILKWIKKNLHWQRRASWHVRHPSWAAISHPTQIYIHTHTHTLSERVNIDPFLYSVVFLGICVCVCVCEFIFYPHSILCRCARFFFFLCALISDECIVYIRSRVYISWLSQENSRKTSPRMWNVYSCESL